MPNTEEKKYEADRLEAQKRFEALPENLKKEILTDKNTKLVADVCKDYSIPEDKVKYVALLVGEVFLGYIKPEEIANELHTFFDFDLQKSNFIEIELKQKLFNPLKADLEKVYNPPKIAEIGEVALTEKEEAAPVIIKAEPVIDRQPTTYEQQRKIPPSIIEISPIKTTPITEKKVEITPSPTTPEPINQTKPAAFSAILTQPEKKLTTPATPAPLTKTVEPIRQTPSLREASAGKQDEPAPEQPFIIQTKEAVKPLAPQFPVGRPSLRLQVEPKLEAKPAPKPISVKFETGEETAGVKFGMPMTVNIPVQKPTAQPIPTTKPIEVPKVVHYSDFRTPLTSMGAPKKPEPKKEDMINLTTFTKVTGNTVDLRPKSSNNE